MKKILWVLALFFCAFGCTNTCTRGNTDNACLTETEGHEFSELVDVVQKYKTDRWNAINSQFTTALETDRGNSGDFVPEGKEDARLIWFSLDSIKQFICTIEKYRDSIKDIDADKLGIMMFYGVYKQHERYKNMHTIFMAPTLRLKGKHGDSTILFDTRANYKLGNVSSNQIEDMFATSDSLFFYHSVYPLIFSFPLHPMSSGMEEESYETIQNNGDLGPPKYRNILRSMDDEAASTD